MLKIQNDTIIRILWKKIREESVSMEEQKILDEWRSASTHNQILFDEVMEEEQWNNDLKLLMDRDEKALFDQMLPEIEEHKLVAMGRPWYKYAAAAALTGVVLLGGTYYFKSGSKQETAKTTVIAQNNKYASHNERASLSLTDGSIIYLDAAANGELAREGSSKINKLTDGELVYDAAFPATNSNQLPLTVNILSTPRGSQYKLTLQDGTKVWLNAASTLRFPSSFSGNQRVVELTGEAYFEVNASKNSSSGHTSTPFFVKVNGMNVEVLGTQFNVMAYNDEPQIITSLIEGSVKVVKGANERLLKPGQQAQVVNQIAYPTSIKEDIRIVSGSNDRATGWKNGYLQFKGADIASVMRQIGRAYKVDIIYKNKPLGNFSGMINLKTNLSEVIRALQLSDLNVKLDGNRILVL